MADNLTKEQRSHCMSKIRSKWTNPERLIHNHLKGRKIKHKMHPAIEGNPDILLKDSNTVIFLHGCYWHKCPKCFKEPKTNEEYWVQKIENNVKRDKKYKRSLKKMKYNIITIWEHQIKKEWNSVLKILIESSCG